MSGGGDWLLLQELLDRGEPESVDRLRAVTDADALGQFAERWYAHPSQGARRLLLEYLERPLNAYRHEALVKRLFKLAEAAGDDAVMARFLVAFDRSIRRVQRAHRHWESKQVGGRDEAERLVALWQSQGYEWATYWQGGLTGRQFVVSGRWSEPYVAMPGGTTMPRGKMTLQDSVYDVAERRQKEVKLADWAIALRLWSSEYRNVSDPSEVDRKRLERFRLFSVATRQY